MNTEVGAMLTPSQRELLNTGGDLNTSTGRSARERIRNRLRVGFIDQLTILRKLSYRDIQTALERRAHPPLDKTRGFSLTTEYQEEIGLENGMAAAIGIVYLAGLERNAPMSEEDQTALPIHTSFVEKRAEKGVRMALNRLGRSTQRVDVSIDISLGEEFDELADLSSQALAEYSMTELQQAHLEGVITDQQFFRAMEKQGRVILPDDESADKK